MDADVIVSQFESFCKLNMHEEICASYKLERELVYDDVGNSIMAEGYHDNTTQILGQ